MEIRQEIGGLYLKFYSEQGCEPHYADCVIRWCDTLETVEVRIDLAMDSDTEKDDEIFFYCKRLNKYIFYSSISLLTFAAKK